MPANKLNYIVLYDHDSQIYGARSKEIALSSPPPVGSLLEEKKIWFVTHEPDSGNVILKKLPDEEVLNAELKERKPTKKKAEET